MHLFSRFSRPERNTNTILDPAASEFVPSTKMPSKREASSSANKPSKAQPSSSTLLSSGLVPNDQPLIKAKDIFKTGEPVIGDMLAIDMSDSMELSDDEFAMLGLGPETGRVRIRPSAKKEGDIRKLSAVLVNFERTHPGTSASESGQSTEHVQYLPLCPAPTKSAQLGGTSSALLAVLPAHSGRIQGSGRTKDRTELKWPSNELPVELFDLITAHLSRDDVKAMRLVSNEFEQKVSRSLFHTSVVPFNTELYDMIDEDKKALTRAPGARSKGKGKMRMMLADQDELYPEIDLGNLQWQNAREDMEGKVYKGHGLRVFQGFGPHIKRFGMSFEVSEKQLSQPPSKKELDHVTSYHGTYDWPAQYYARFANLAGLENTADETSRMKAAFANLDIVQELGLSIDSGLGWLNGPDKSVRSSIFDRPSSVFGTAYDVPDRAQRAATDLWTALRQSQQSFDPSFGLKEIMLDYNYLTTTPSELDGLKGKTHSNTQLWSSIEQSKVPPGLGLTGFGVMFTTHRNPELSEQEVSAMPLVPSQLRKEQKEWLLETHWAQQAFLESYMLAVIDNPSNFGRVTTLNVAQLSSRFLSMLSRQFFWDALPCLSAVTLHNPSEAVRMFHKEILRDRISLRESIKSLDIGWVGGGEHADGMHSRNSNVLPAPITQIDHCTANSSIFGIVFKYVEHLTLSNCWITPPALEGLVKSHFGKALKKLTLDSVSLTAHPRFPANNHGGGGGGGGPPQHLAQALQLLQAQLGNNAGQINQQQLQLAQQQNGGFAQQVAQLGPGFLQGMNAQQMALLQQQWNMNFAQVQQNWQILQPANQPGALNMNMQQWPPLPPMIGAPHAPGQAAFLGNAINNLAPPAAAHWTDGHREGSWPQVLDALSPGPIFTDYLSAPQPWEEQHPPRPETTLTTLEFKSCGYAKLPNHGGFDQLVFQPNLTCGRFMSQWFLKRFASLKSLMMDGSRDRNLGQIVQYMPQTEMDALQFAWGLTEGWSDRAKAEEATYDGYLPGGSGRFSGRIEKGMGLVSRMDIGASA
ncbi:hypothetical protein LTR37_000372 [Vermiconidia calcicola]|uniref:Uncharacterized protein n=1 Tax=Vermiconidia calcicola TaxID=1690605 RepID=A0ACC3P004_9PEZI|nr:hypothetical protein LTR37_000372 [Vermiconidia calcicola]